jgi:hypothetical protein
VETVWEPDKGLLAIGDLSVGLCELQLMQLERVAVRSVWLRHLNDKSHGRLGLLSSMERVAVDAVIDFAMRMKEYDDLLIVEKVVLSVV